MFSRHLLLLEYYRGPMSRVLVGGWAFSYVRGTHMGDQCHDIPLQEQKGLRLACAFFSDALLAHDLSVEALIFF